MSAPATRHPENPLSLDGIEFVELASPDPDALATLFFALGMSRTAKHERRAIDLFEQGNIRFLLNREPRSFAARFAEAHGPCIASMGWRTRAGAAAARIALERGARPADGDLTVHGAPVPAIFGIGDSLIHLVDVSSGQADWRGMGFEPLARPDVTTPKGFFAIDHLTNNVEKGTMERWASFYKDIFGFTEVRTFDIRGEKTGLQSYALRSPCGTFCIPINEADEAKSQINEYLREYRGPGIQHLALITEDLLGSLAALDGTIAFLDIEPGYHDEAFARVPNVVEDHEAIRKRQVLVDGDADGYLLQIFTQNVIGPIFFELIQRHHHDSFGEGNFAALFRSIERDQMRRGTL